GERRALEGTDGPLQLVRPDELDRRATLKLACSRPRRSIRRAALSLRHHSTAEQAVEKLTATEAPVLSAEIEGSDGTEPKPHPGAVLHQSLARNTRREHASVVRFAAGATDQQHVEGGTLGANAVHRGMGQGTDLQPGLNQNEAMPCRVVAVEAADNTFDSTGLDTDEDFER